MAEEQEEIIIIEESDAAGIEHTNIPDDSIVSDTPSTFNKKKIIK